MRNEKKTIKNFVAKPKKKRQISVDDKLADLCRM